MQSTLPLDHDVLRGGELVHALAPRTLAGKAILAVAASAFVALAAHVSVPLYFTPVPLTLQTFAVILVGLTLGPTIGFSAMLLYLAEGASGLPVFSPHGLGGFAQLLGPTGGFLLSYPLAAGAAGAVVRGLPTSRARFAAAILAGTVASIFIFALGPAWLGHYLHLSMAGAWHKAIAPFLPVEAVKVVAAAGIYSSLRSRRQT